MENIKRVQRAIDFIEENLKEELPVDKIAQVACFSMWHFQRVFSSVVGDSVKDYVRKRRMSSALLELGSTDRRILDIAIDHHFESQESFTRAFKAHFGQTPGECRKEGFQSVLSLTKPRITIQYLDHLYGGLTMQPRFEEVQEMKVVGLGNKFISILSPDKSNQDVIPMLWADLIKRSDEIKNKKNAKSIGYTAEPSDGKSQPDEYFYLAGVEVLNGKSIPEGMILKIIPEGRYAVFTHKGKIDKLEHTMRYIFGSWVPKSNEELREAPTFSVQGENFNPNSDQSSFEIYIPVQ